jgi:hypothetical protein
MRASSIKTSMLKRAAPPGYSPCPLHVVSILLIPATHKGECAYFRRGSFVTPYPLERLNVCSQSAFRSICGKSNSITKLSSEVYDRHVTERFEPIGYVQKTTTLARTNTRPRNLVTLSSARKLHMSLSMMTSNSSLTSCSRRTCRQRSLITMKRLMWGMDGVKSDAIGRAPCSIHCARKITGKVCKQLVWSRQSAA